MTQVRLPDIRVGNPMLHESLSVFPIYCDDSSNLDYRLSSQALADESLLVSEVDEDGSVPNLLVENKGNTSILFLEGEELIGAKQNRVLNMTVLVAPHTTVRIPVSCVEQGRWRSESQYFESSGSHSPVKLRHVLKASVSKSIKEDSSHASDQSEVWREVAQLHQTHGIDSETSAMSAAFDSHQDQISDFLEDLPYAKEASGFAIAVGDQVVSIDLFDKPSTCQQVWDRMLSGVVFDAMAAGKTSEPASVGDVEQLLKEANESQWTRSAAIGEGEEHRAESARGTHASALSVEQTVIHGSVLASR